MDPLSIVSASLGIAGTTIGGLNAVWEFLKICQQIKDAPENAQIFIRLLKQVTEDFDYAMTFRSCVQDRSRTQPTMQDKFIYRVLMGTVEELDDFGRHVQQYDQDKFDESRPLDSFKAKVRFALKDVEYLKLRREGLRAAHNRLLSAVTTMHFMAPNVVTPGIAMPTRPLSAPAGQGKARPRRASRMPSVEDDEEKKDQDKTQSAVLVDTAPMITSSPPAYCERFNSRHMSAL